ncbi:dioxygenase [Paenibacillus sp. MWE-103]|uniref:Dioxygenase n=1 Tax=Paenibacillus artemisiicola TaxID=1172618 RepID=A0ABS3WI54_9BACL|nr:class III extradiol ring-cleavage dioxygenase [Paenibacillus artemisiicola]MBO7747983.1 dioxygenase [Paenibacillus artemisiicola]
MMPAYFFAHGAPSLVLERHAYTDFLGDFAAGLPKPKAIVLFSAHWEHTTQTVSTADTYETIYDFSGFPDALYRITYPAKGDRKLSEDIRALFDKHGIPSRFDGERGLDHGAWAVLKLLFPDAGGIPVVALSVNRHLTNGEQYRIGSALAELREQDVLIIGSGGTVHNLRRLSWGAEIADDWALAFDAWLQEKLEAWDTAALFDYRSQAPYALDAVPTNEHFIPLLIAMGAGSRNRTATLLHRSYQLGSLSLSCWQFD